MIHINELYKAFTAQYNTSQLGFFRPTTDFVPAVHTISLALFNKLASAPTNNQYKEWLAPFVRRVNVSVEKGGEYERITKPPDFQYFSAAEVLIELGEQDEILNTFCEKGCDLVQGGECIPYPQLAEDFFPSPTVSYKRQSVKLIQAERWAAISTHLTMGPSPERIYITPASEGYEIAPSGIGTVVLKYYRGPVAPVFNFTQRASGPDVFLDFVEAGSVHPEWSEALRPVFLYRLGTYYGLTTQDQLTLQVSNIPKEFYYD